MSRSETLLDHIYKSYQRPQSNLIGAPKKSYTQRSALPTKHADMQFLNKIAIIAEMFIAAATAVTVPDGTCI